MTHHTPDPRDPVELLLTWFNAAVREHHAAMIEGLGDAHWNLPASRRRAARRLIKMWEENGAAGFGDLPASLVNRPPGASSVL